MGLTRIVSAVAVVLAVLPLTASAEPILQLYAEGATYDTVSESWVTEGPEFVLWAIGNVDGPGGKGDILDVKLAVAYDKDASFSISFMPTTADPAFGFSDPSTPSARVSFSSSRTEACRCSATGAASPRTAFTTSRTSSGRSLHSAT